MNNEEFHKLLELGKWSGIISRQFENYIKREMKPYDVGFVEFFFLMGIGLDYKIKDKRFFFEESLCIDKAVLTRSLKALACKGYIKQAKPTEACPHAELTARGQEVQAFGRKVLQIWWDIVFKDIPEEMLKLMYENQRRMALNILSVTSPTAIKTGRLPE